MKCLDFCFLCSRTCSSSLWSLPRAGACLSSSARRRCSASRALLASSWSCSSRGSEASEDSRNRIRASACRRLVRMSSCSARIAAPCCCRSASWRRKWVAASSDCSARCHSDCSTGSATSAAVSVAASRFPTHCSAVVTCGESFPGPLDSALTRC